MQEEPKRPENLATWHPKIRELYEYWTKIHPAAGKLPGRAHFDPMRVAHLLPHVMLLDVEGRPPRFRYRLIGTRMVDSLGADLTGKWLDQVHARDGTSSPQFPSYSKVAVEALPEWRRGKPHFSSYIDKCTEMERVFMPLAANGTDVDMILTIAVFFDRAGHEL
ncbi:MAG TPA: PAS domain-containing protein [Alphaproteobacteria bacterium]